MQSQLFLTKFCTGVHCPGVLMAPTLTFGDITTTCKGKKDTVGRGLCVCICMCGACVYMSVGLVYSTFLKWN